ITLHLPGGGGAPQAVTGKPLPASIDVEMFTHKDDIIGARAVNDVNALFSRGGLLLEVTQDQLLNLYDASDPGHVRPCDSKNLFAEARGVTMDDAGRILVTMGGGGTPGRIQVFLLTSSAGSGDCGGRKLIDAEKLESSFTILTVRTGTPNPPVPEGFPRTIHLFSNDQSEEVVLDRDTPTLVTFQETDASPADGKQDRDAPLQVSGTIPSSGAPSPLNQPATVFNVTTGRSWTAFVDGTGAFSIDARASSGDRLKIVLNNSEIALVATLSFGIQGVEVNRTMHEIGQSCDPDSGGADSICPEKMRLLFSFGGAPDTFGAPPTVNLCRAYDASNNCADLVSDLERLNDLDLLPGVVGPSPVQPPGQPLIVGAVARFGLGLFTIGSGSGGYQVSQVGPGVTLKTPGIPPTFPQIFAVAAARDFPVKPPAERKSCLSSKWPDYKPSLAFAAAGTTGVFVVDVTDATNPEQVGLFKVSNTAAGANTLALDAERGLLYVGLGGDGIAVYDMTDPCTTALPSGMATPDDPRVISRIPVVNENVNVPFTVDPDTGVLFGAADAGDGAPPNSGEAFALSPLDPPLRWIADTDHDGRWENVGSAIPLGVSNPAKPSIPYPPDVVRALASVWGGAGKEITAEVSSTSNAGIALSELKAGFPRTKTYVTLTRQSDDPADPGYNRYLSPPIVLIADPRARKDYDIKNKPAERDDGAADPSKDYACHNCVVDAGYAQELSDWAADSEGVTPTPPAKKAIEQWAGEKLQVRLAWDSASEAAVKNNLTYLSKADLLRIVSSIATTRGDLTPELAQIPAQNPSLFTTEAGVAIDTHAGGSRMAWTDLAIKGRGIDFVLSRYYVSNLLHWGPFGRNIDSPLFARLRDLPSGNVDFYPGDGSRHTFRFKGDHFEAPKGVFLDLYRLPDRTFFLIYPDQTRLLFDESGR
ncbi:MAG TPA: DUF6531 domain-containing protein, partial [Thermoanaerobaculia bacterium]|nr:DUF6531 domain-containing protein [Thermoanaerobaculia bacterium]